MIKILLSVSFLCFSIFAHGQCDELFFSEYVEGYANNKALEIYNPTGEAVNLSDYSIARFSNGSTVAGNNKIIQLPNEMLAANDVFVVVVDLTDVEDFDSQYDKPAWNGFNVIDTLFDQVTGEVIIDEETGEPVIGPQYVDGNAIFGDEYNEAYDLQCKADAFLCPDYDTNNTMYFNGNDAMVLLSGTEVANDGSNILDVIGVIGEDPTVTMMQDAWVDADGSWLTKDKSLMRNADVTTGRNDFSEIIASSGGSFTGENWTVYRKNDFSRLGIHNCNCHDEKSELWSCTTGEGPLSTTNLNVIDFKVFPNPNSTGLLQIEADENIGQVELINMMGQQVLTESFDAGQNTANVNFPNIQKGIYIIKVHFSDENISTRKLIVQ